MHARELVEVAGLVAYQAPTFVVGATAPHLPQLEQYWAAAKGRYESWQRALRAVAAPDGDSPPDAWIEIRAALDEILTSELLTRVWTAVLVSGERRGQQSGERGVAEPIARNVFDTHLEARSRVLQLLVGSGALAASQVRGLDRLRRRVERWSDVLVGSLWSLGDVGEFAVDAQRAGEFAAALAERRADRGGQHAWRLMLVSLRNAFQTGLSPIAANGEANARIAASVLGSFPGELFDSTGLFKSLWMMRLSATASDAQGLVSQLLEPSARPAHARPKGLGRRRI